MYHNFLFFMTYISPFWQSKSTLMLSSNPGNWQAFIWLDSSRPSILLLLLPSSNTQRARMINFITSAQVPCLLRTIIPWHDETYQILCKISLTSVILPLGKRCHNSVLSISKVLYISICTKISFWVYLTANLNSLILKRLSNRYNRYIPLHLNLEHGFHNDSKMSQYLQNEKYCFKKIKYEWRVAVRYVAAWKSVVTFIIT